MSISRRRGHFGSLKALLPSTGTISVIGFWLGGASTCNFIAGMVLAIAEFMQPEYEIQRWHHYLVYVAVIWAAIALNVFGSKLLPAFNELICAPPFNLFLSTPR